MNTGLHVKSCQTQWNLNFLESFPKKPWQHQISWKSVPWEPSCTTRMGGQTWLSYITFCNFAKVPKKEQIQLVNTQRYTVITVFTWIQDDSYLNLSPKQNISPKGKCIYPNIRQPPKNKSLLRKHNLLLIANVRFYLPLPISVTVSNFRDSAFNLLILTPKIPIHITVITQHITISLVHCTGCTTRLKYPSQQLLVISTLTK